MNHEFSQAMQRFVQSIRMRHPTSTTATHYHSDLEQFRRVLDQAPRKITRADITRFVTVQLTAGLSASTVNRRLATLSSFFEFLADEAGDDHWPNPVAWRTHRVAQGSHLPRDLPEATARQFWQAVGLGSIRDQALIALMLDVGLRVGEVAVLRVQDLEAASSRDGLSALRVRGKGDKERRVWLVPETAVLIRQWLADRPAVAEDALFITRRRRGFSIRGIQDRVKHYTQEAGLAIDQVSCHRLRHTFARRMAESRMPLPSLSHWLGHSQLTTTQIYIDGANPDIRTDYRAAMSSLQEATASTKPEATAPKVARGEPAPKAIQAPHPPLSTSEVADKISTLPPWVRTRIVDFLQAKQVRWSPQHRRARASQWLGELRRAWLWFLDEYQMNSFADLSRVHLHAYLTHLQDQELSAHTINHFLTTFWSFLSFAEEQGEPIVPGLYRVPRPQKPEWQPRPLAEDEYQRLEHVVLTAAAVDAEAGALHQSWFLLLSDGGMRISELEALSVRDWDPTTQTLHIRHGKGGRERRIPVTFLARVLQWYLASRPMAQHQEPLLLYRGRAIPAPYIRKRLRAFATQAGVENVTPHRLRHTYATRLLNTGRMPVTTLQKLMGHRYVDTTMRYAALYDQTIRRDYEAAMAQAQSHSEPEFDWTLWGPTIEDAFRTEGDTVDVLQSTTVTNCM